MLLSVCAVACGSDSTSPAVSVAGTYTLRSVNGVALPATIQQDATAKVEVLDDQIILSGSGSYGESGHTRATFSSNTAVDTIPEIDAGVYTLSGTSLFLVSGIGNGRLSGTVSGTTLTFVNGANMAVYTK